MSTSEGFRWHLMRDEKPEYGPKTYVILGNRGKARVVHGFKTIDGTDLFHEYKNGFGYVYADKVRAWAELPLPEEE